MRRRVQKRPPVALRWGDVAERKGMDEREITTVRRTREVLRVTKSFFI